MRNAIRRLRGSTLAASVQLVPADRRSKLVKLLLVQVFLGALDLVAVALVGLLGTVAVAGIQSRPLDGRIAALLDTGGLSSQGPQAQVAVLAVLTAAMFLGRTAASIYLTRRALHFLGLRAAEASSDLISRLLSQPLTYLQARSSQEFLFSVTTSANALVLGVLGTVVIMAADASLLLAMSVLLFVTSPLVACLAAAMMIALVLVLHRLTASRAHDLGVQLAELDVASRQSLVEALSTLREMTVRGSKAQYVHELSLTRVAAAAANAEWTFLPNIAKYALESAVIVGALVIGAVQFAVTDAQSAVSALAVFLAAGTRLTPAIMRLQQGTIALRGNAGQGAAALKLLSELPAARSEAVELTRFLEVHVGFQPHIEIAAATFTYPGADVPAVRSLNLDIQPGQMVALVGPSGAGKSTAADLLLGVLVPESGEVLISGLPAREALRTWPGALGYVPQDVWINDGSIRDNITLGFAEHAVPTSAVVRALHTAQLEAVVQGLPAGVETRLGERGARLSGGQRQRLGIARALVTSPRILVLDEATSALDADTEHQFTQALEELRGQVTLVVIAHRLAAVRSADIVIYMDGGRVIASGTFDEVRSAVPDFDRQAILLGL